MFSAAHRYLWLSIVGVLISFEAGIVQAELLSKATADGCSIESSAQQLYPGEEFTLTMTAFGDKADMDIVENAGFLGTLHNWVGDLPATLTLLAPLESSDYTFYVWRENDEKVYGGCEISVEVIAPEYHEEVYSPSCHLFVEKNTEKNFPLEKGDELLLSWRTENTSSAQLFLAPTRTLNVVDNNRLPEGTQIVRNWYEEEYRLQVWNRNGHSSTCIANINDITERPVPMVEEAVYVRTTGDDNGVGDQTDPFKTIQHGIDVAVQDDAITQVWVAEGRYEEQIDIDGKSQNISLFGGFNLEDWSDRNVDSYETVVTSKGSWALHVSVQGQGIVHGVSHFATGVTQVMVLPKAGAAIYVSSAGNDGAEGTRSDPIPTIQGGVDAVMALNQDGDSTNDKSQVWVAGGEYKESVVMTGVAGSISLFGGYNPRPGPDQWFRSIKDHKTMIKSPHSWAVRVSDYDAASTIQGFFIEAQDAVGESLSSIGIVLNDISASMTLMDNEVTTLAGRHGNEGLAGNAGGVGLSGEEGGGTTGGKGGDGAPGCEGGHGGGGNFPGMAGNNGGTIAVPINRALAYDWRASDGKDGVGGGCGSRGTSGNGGLCVNPFWPLGPPHSPGGGGGGGAGQGGSGASGGTGGGGSIGILIINSNRVFVSGSIFESGYAGNGGDGNDNGGTGGPGGPGGPGALCWGAFVAGGGLTGGWGGDGGDGKGSAGGDGGLSAGIIRVNSSITSSSLAANKHTPVELGGKANGTGGVGSAGNGLTSSDVHLDVRLD
ncbi:hypothetical protein A9Q99_04000 [Gammaproteobacteria bacterium 45_16_T64]|nr:hypothetical protein A9Q99_04000 [Gammaproteobacteria bacterium 45_16_T64]